MKFAHLADCHVGGWREDSLKQLSIQAFTTAIEMCVQERVDFIIVAGDLFNNSLPAIDALKEVAKALKRAQDNKIRVYLVPGSHDYSPSGKTMLDVLEQSGLCVNVYTFNDGFLSFTVDGPTGVKLTGMCGLSGGLEKLKYKELALANLEEEKGFKIFLFHTLLEEFKPPQFSQIEGEPVASLPKNFDYYAGGHPHFVFQTKKEGYGLITYPGPLFPNNFKELEELKHGGFYIVDEYLRIKHIPVTLKDTIPLYINADGKLPSQIEQEIKHSFQSQDFTDKIITLRVEGTLDSGKPADIPFKELFSLLPRAYCILKNTTKLTTKELTEIPVDQGHVENVEEKIIEEHLGQITSAIIPREKELEFTTNLIRLFEKEKDEGERTIDFEQRIINDIQLYFTAENLWK